MSTLHLHQVVEDTFRVLAQQMKQDERAHLACHGLESMREALLQMVLQESCIEHQRILDFIRKSLLLLKGRLMAWKELDVPADAVDLPLTPIPQGYWKSKHPSKSHFAEDVAEAVSTMQQFPRAFEAQPWQWLSDLFLDVRRTLQ